MVHVEAEWYECRTPVVRGMVPPEISGHPWGLPDLVPHAHVFRFDPGEAARQAAATRERARREAAAKVDADARAQALAKEGAAALSACADKDELGMALDAYRERVTRADCVSAWKRIAASGQLTPTHEVVTLRGTAWANPLRNIYALRNPRPGNWQIRSRTDAWLVPGVGRLFHPSSEFDGRVAGSRWEEALDVCVEADGNMWVPSNDAIIWVDDRATTARVVVRRGSGVRIERCSHRGHRAARVETGRRFERPFNGDGPSTAAAMLAALDLRPTGLA